MKKTFYSMLLLCVFFSQNLLADDTPKKTQNHLKDLNLKGNVKTFKLTPYKAVDYFGKIIKGNKQDFWNGDVVIVFDQEGFKTETNRYNKIGQLSQKVIYKYDEQGKRTTRDVYNSFGKVQVKFLYVYDDKGNKVAYNSYSPTGELNDTYSYVNDEKGRILEELWTKSDKSFGSKYTYKYDPKTNHLIETCQYTKSETEIDNCTRYKYNNKTGLITEIEIYNSENVLIRKTVISYDEKGNEKSLKNFNKDGDFIDEKEYSYVYDNNGNWIERTEYVNQFPKSIIEREITYY
ncbi:sugar-binding protein [Capnocytophaga catalasegens]|uniref:Sugar-binding protein n=1 Tax=Capnocytophaga catalasegens TaxID=1004260 RepID=A0AAV5AYP0_9FLAO|nr:sugar-binding protein [Capnocytophaga catalasegens]GJM51020.1 hypothetical protein RCZ15_19930 [Capnocytophaga catalasegens]